MKKILIKFAVLLGIFIGTIGIYFAVTMDRKEEKKEIMQTASLPIVAMVYNEKTVNTLHGYTIDMNGKYMRDSVTPIGENRSVSFKVDMYGNVIAGISYELRSLDTERLIEKQM